MEPRENAEAHVGLVELCRVRRRIGQETAPHRREGHQCRAQLLTGLHHSDFRVAHPEGIFRLHRRDGVHSSPAAQLVRTHFRKARQTDLAFADKLRQRPDRILDRDVRVRPVKVVEVDHVRLQTLQARLAGSLDHLRTAIQGPLAILEAKDAFAGQEKS